MKKILILIAALVGFAVAEAYRANPISAQSYENSNANSAVSAAVTVSTMPTLIPITGLDGFDRELLKLQNNHGSNVLYVTFENMVDTSTYLSSTTIAGMGYKLAAGAVLDLHVAKSVPVYVTLAGDSGTSDVMTMQLGYK